MPTKLQERILRDLLALLRKSQKSEMCVSRPDLRELFKGRPAQDLQDVIAPRDGGAGPFCWVKREYLLDRLENPPVEPKAAAPLPKLQTPKPRAAANELHALPSPKLET